MSDLVKEVAVSNQHQHDNSLTDSGDWIRYYEGRELEQIERLARFPSIIDPYLQQKRGRVFELGCGGSHQLAHCALSGWEVGGIDFNPDALGLIREFLSRRNCDIRNLLCADIFSADESALAGEFDLLVSFGFLEHFRDPRVILSKWKNVLSDDGLVISVIPNLHSINAPLMRRFDPEFWAQHVPYSPQEMDLFHVESGLTPVVPACYTGHYDIDMLIPWEKIRQSVNNRIVAKLLRYMAYFLVGKTIALVPAQGNRHISSYIVGTYRKS